MTGRQRSKWKFYNKHKINNFCKWSQSPLFHKKTMLKFCIHTFVLKHEEQPKRIRLINYDYFPERLSMRNNLMSIKLYLKKLLSFYKTTYHYTKGNAFTMATQDFMVTPMNKATFVVCNNSETFLFMRGTRHEIRPNLFHVKFHHISSQQFYILDGGTDFVLQKPFSNGLISQANNFLRHLCQERILNWANFSRQCFVTWLTFPSKHHSQAHVPLEQSCLA